MASCRLFFHNGTEFIGPQFAMALFRSRKYKIKNDIRSACEGHAQADLQDAKSGPSPGEAANSKFRIQDSKLCSGCSLRRARQVRQRTVGLRRREAAARRPLPRSIPVASDKPAAERMGLHERPADARMQPSARGRLRAAGRCATELDTTPSATNSSCGPLGPDGPIPHTAQRLPKQHTRHPAVCSPPPAIATNLVAGIPCLD